MCIRCDIRSVLQKDKSTCECPVLSEQNIKKASPHAKVLSEQTQKDKVNTRMSFLNKSRKTIQHAIVLSEQKQKDKSTRECPV